MVLELEPTVSKILLVAFLLGDQDTSHSCYALSNERADGVLIGCKQTMWENRQMNSMLYSLQSRLASQGLNLQSKSLPQLNLLRTHGVGTKWRFLSKHGV